MNRDSLFSLGLKTASDFASENASFDAPEEKPIGEAGKCDTDIFTQYGIDMSQVDVKLRCPYSQTLVDS